MATRCSTLLRFVLFCFLYFDFRYVNVFLTKSYFSNLIVTNSKVYT